jgi:apolipoprotein N-acyltransferase
MKPRSAGTIPAPAEAAKNTKNAAVRKTLKLAFLSAVLLAAAFPRVHFYWLACVALVPLFLALHRSSNYRQAFAGAATVGFFFFLLSVHWLRHVSLFGLVFVSCLQGLFFGLFGLYAKRVLTRVPGLLVRLLALAAGWTVMEFTRGEIPVLGFGWNQLAYSQSSNLLVIQSARLFGAYGVTFLLALVNAAVFQLFVSRGLKTRSAVFLAGFLPFALNVYYGGFHVKTPAQGPVLDVTVIQGNIDQALKWSEGVKGLIIEKYLKLTELASFDGPDLIIWPEAAYPDFFNEEYAGSPIPALMEKLGLWLLVGSPHREDPVHYYNSSYLISNKGDIVSRYDKIHLVPFGEYVPFKRFLFFLERYAYVLGVSDFSAGRKFRVFEMPAGKDRVRFSALICFEDIFAGLARRFVDEGAEALFVITNDAWFGKTGAPYQHLEASIFRALENGVPVVRAGNIGVSAFIAPNGEVQDTVKNERGFETYITGALTRPVVFSRTPTFYRRGGHFFPWGCAGWVALCFLYTMIGQKSLKKED